MGKGSAPKPPDPQDLARTQSQVNLDTAIANNRMGMVDQVTPWGSVTYQEIPGTASAPAAAAPAAPAKPRMQERYNEATGKYEWIPVGRTSQPAPTAAPTATTAPRYQATTTLAGAGKNMFDLATNLSGQLGGVLGMPVNLNNEATEARLMDLGRKRLDPALARRTESLRTTLSNQGIKEGSEAFDRAMARDMEGGNDAYNQLLLSGRGQAVQEALLERSTPLNELSALLSGSQVGVPQNTFRPQGVNPVDVAGLEMQGYQNDLNRYNSKPKLTDIMGGLFGMATGGINPTSFMGRAMAPRPEQYAQYGGGR